MTVYLNARNLMTNYDESDIQAPYNDLVANSSGIVTPGALVVAPNSGMTIQVAAGALLQYISSLSNFYRVYSDAVTNLTIANNSSGSTRIDLICVKFDPTITPDANASNIASILIVQGTAGAGIPATPTNHYVLAEITVASGAASIGAGQITDKRAGIALSNMLNSAVIVTTGGGTTAYTLTPTPAITAYVTGQEYTIKINATNTGPSTVNISGLGAKSLTKGGATALASGDLLINATYKIIYDGTQFQVIGISGSGATAATRAEIATGTSNALMATPQNLHEFHVPPQGFLYNGKIVPSVASNNLTVALKGLDGNDPSATNPVYVRIGDTVRSITAALSFTVAAAANTFNAGSAELATNEIDLFVYLFYSTSSSAVGIGLSRVPYFTVMSNSATRANELFMDTSVGYNTTDTCEVVGRFAATLSAGAGYTWTVPTFTATNLIQRPIYETRLLSWTPTFTGFSAAPSGPYAKYKVSLNFCNVIVRCINDGTSNATGFSLTAPFTSRTVSGMYWQYPSITRDNGANVGIGDVYIASASNSLTIEKLFTSPSFTTSGGKAGSFDMKYEI